MLVSRAFPQDKRTRQLVRRLDGRTMAMTGSGRSWTRAPQHLMSELSYEADICCIAIR